MSRLNNRREWASHSVTTNLPFIPSWPSPQKIVAVKFKGSHLIRGEGNSGDFVWFDVTSNLKGGTIEAMEAIQRGQFQDHRDSFFQVDFIWVIFEFFGLDLDHLLLATAAVEAGDRGADD